MIFCRNRRDPGENRQQAHQPNPGDHKEGATPPNGRAESIANWNAEHHCRGEAEQHGRNRAAFSFSAHKRRGDRCADCNDCSVSGPRSDAPDEQASEGRRKPDDEIADGEESHQSDQCPASVKSADRNDQKWGADGDGKRVGGHEAARFTHRDADSARNLGQKADEQELGHTNRENTQGQGVETERRVLVDSDGNGYMADRREVHNSSFWNALTSRGMSWPASRGASQLGWLLLVFASRLDSVLDKLSELPGIHGDASDMAGGRKLDGGRAGAGSHAPFLIWIDHAVRPGYLVPGRDGVPTHGSGRRHEHWYEGDRSLSRCQRSRLSGTQVLSEEVGKERRIDQRCRSVGKGNTRPKQVRNHTRWCEASAQAEQRLARIRNECSRVDKRRDVG